uniref:Bifunctional inhibitor/plant lipid transfer protein/seed storage helical domain-containing protein n=1 Tax=Ananas comosus var. bracteatus TaxID=296719 RepID=A0A6V7QAH3_ANACO|nr:unnamed protein product [Ananas comosus var. bracteatus]
MEHSTSKATALLLTFMLFLSSITPIVSCGYCPPNPNPNPKPPSRSPEGGPGHREAAEGAEDPRPPRPGRLRAPLPSRRSSVLRGFRSFPQATHCSPSDRRSPVPPVIGPPFPPVIGPPVPPVVGPPTTPSPGSGATPCPPPPVTPVTPAPPASCPVDTLKLGACVDLLGGLVHIGIGDPVVNKCCPLLEGLVEIEAAVCLCTTIKIKLLNINIYLPLALQLLLTCGKTPPPGYTCTI